MRDALAHGLRRTARWLIAVSNRLLPPVEATEEDFAEWTGIDLAWANTQSGGGRPSYSGPAQAAPGDDMFTTRYHLPVNLTGCDGSVWPIAGPPTREEC